MRYLLAFALVLVATVVVAQNGDVIELGRQAVVGSNRPKPSQLRENLMAQLTAVETTLLQLEQSKAEIDAALAVATSAQMQVISDEWQTEFRNVWIEWGGSVDEAAGRIAQINADFSETAGVEGGANELRLYRGGVVIPVDQDTP